MAVFGEEADHAMMAQYEGSSMLWWVLNISAMLACGRKSIKVMDVAVGDGP